MNSKYIVILGTPPARIDATERMMATIREAVGVPEISGFTLFENAKGWQMSVRRKAEQGWDVKIVTEDEARRVLSMLEAAGHPEGPITVKRSIGKHPALGAPYGQPSFEASLDAAAEAVRALTAVIEAWIPE